MCAALTSMVGVMVAAQSSRDKPLSEDRLAELRARAQKGYAQDQIELAAAYLTGRGVLRDPAQAAHWYLKAAESGNPEAQNEIGYFYQLGIGLPTDAAKAAHWFQLASSGGFEWAKVNLGVSFLRGVGVPRNPSMARQLFLEAVHKGSGRGATYLGIMEYFGIGVPVDKAEAERWFETGAKLHDPEAAYDLALLFAGPAGTPHKPSRSDPRRAAELLRFAAEKGYVPAMHSLGLLLVNHPELPQRDGEAKDALEQASGAGNWRSSVLLGVLWRDGKAGATQDPTRAFFYFKLAGEQGGADAARLVAPDIRALSRQLPAELQSAAAAEADAAFRQHPSASTFVAKEGEDPGFPLVALVDSGLNP